MTHLRLLTALLLAALPSAVRAQGRTFDVGDARIYFEVTGTGEPVVFMHGWTQDLTIWDDQVPVFAQAYQVIRFDRRGYGRSSGDADDSADPADLAILLDSLGIRSASVVGLSAGAATAMRFAAAFPGRVDRLVLYGYGGLDLEGFPVPAPDFGFQQFVEIAQVHGLDSLWLFLRASPLAWAPPDRPFPEEPPASWQRYNGRDLTDPQPPTGRVPALRWDRIGSLQVPTLLVNGDHDLPYALLVADSLERRLPNVRRVIITNGGHGAHFHQPEQFNRALLEFFASVPRRSGSP